MQSSTSIHPPARPRNSLGPVRILVALLAAARITRLVTTDWLFEWYVASKARRWALEHEGMVDPKKSEVTRIPMLNGGHVTAHRYPHGAHRTKLVSGLDCEHCVGFWASAVVLVAVWLPLPKPLAYLRDRGLDTFAASYVVGHVSSRLDG